MNTELKELSCELLNFLSKSNAGAVLRIESSGLATIREFGKPDRILNSKNHNENIILYIHNVMAYEKDVCYNPNKKQFASLIHSCKGGSQTSFFKIESIPETLALDITILK